MNKDEKSKYAFSTSYAIYNFQTFMNEYEFFGSLSLPFKPLSKPLIPIPSQLDKSTSPTAD